MSSIEPPVTKAAASYMMTVVTKATVVEVPTDAVVAPLAIT